MGLDRNAIGVAVFAALIAIISVKSLDVGMEANQKAAALQPPATIHTTRPGTVTDDAVRIQFQGTRHRNCALSVTAEWELPGGVRLSRANPNKATFQPGETGWAELEIGIPPGLQPGAYRVRSVAEYKCPDGGVFIVPTGWIEATL